MLSLKELLQLRWINSRNRDMRSNSVNHQGKQQKRQSTTQVAELSGLSQLSCVSSHLILFTRCDKRF